MDRVNHLALLERSPTEYHPRIRLFLEFAQDLEVSEVPDPYYGGAKGFDEVLDLVEDAAAGLLAELRRK